MKKNYFLILIVILSINYTSLFATETLTPVHIQSNNASSNLAKVGHNIALTFTSSGAISGVVVTIAGHNITGGNLTNTGNNWTATYTTVVGDTEGIIPFTIDFTEMATPVTSTTDLSSVTFDKTAPSAPIISGISSGYHNTDQIFTVSGEAGAAIEYSINNGGVWTAYAAAVTISSEGSYNVLARQTDQAGNGPTASGVIVLTIDKTSPAAPVISGISAGYHNADQIFTANGEAGATIEYSINNGGAWTAYAGAVTISSEGSYSVLARQTDQAGNGPTASGVIALTIDKTSPAAPVISGILAGYHNTDQIFTVNGEAGATIEYSINNGGAWTAYAGAVTLSSEGGYNVLARQTDQAGNGPTTSGVIALTIDKTSPAAPVISGISTGYHNTDQIFTVSGEAGATIEYSTNNGGLWTAYSGAVTLSSEGSYNVLARQTDQAGNGPTASGVIALTIDKTNPAAPVISGISAGTYSVDQIFTISGEAGATIEYSINNGGAWTAYTGAVTISSEGSYNILARQTDQAGNGSIASGVISLTIDKTGPNAPTVTGVTPTNDQTPTWTWSSGGGGGNLTFRYKLDNNDLTSGATTTTSLSYTPGTNLTETSHTLYVQERDASGNWSASGSFVVTIDVTTQAPILTLPATSSYENKDLEIDFSLPEAALSGSVKMTFTRISGTADPTPHVLTFKSTFESLGQHSTMLNGQILTSNVNVLSITGNPWLEDGATYKVKIEYSDALGNAVASIENTDLNYNNTNPEATIEAISPSPRKTAVDLATINFTSFVWWADVNRGDFILTRNGSNVSLGSTPAVTYTLEAPYVNSARKYYIDLSSQTALDGSYVLTLKAAGSGIKDWYGNSFITDASISWTMDATPPTLTSVHIQSNNANSTFAKPGNEVTVSFTASETIQTPTATINGNVASVSFVSGNSWTAKYTMVNGDTEGNITFNISFQDLAGNSANVNSVSDGSSVTFLKSTPTLATATIKSNNANIALAKSGNTITLDFTSTKALANVVVTIASHTISATGSNGDKTWTTSYTIVGTDMEGVIPFTIDFTDKPGNAGVSVTSTTDASNVIFDRTNPTLTNVTIYSNNTYADRAGVGTKVFVTFTSSENLGSGTVSATIAGKAATISGSNQSWTASYTMQTTDNPEGIITFGINYKDLVGNSGALVSTVTDASSVTFDKTSPTLSSVSVVSSNITNTLAKVGDAITVSFTAGEVVEGVSIKLNGKNLVATNPSGNNWSASYTMLSSDAEGSLFVTIDCKDQVGNTAQTTNSDVTFDKTLPAFTEIKIASNNASSTSYAKEGDEVTITFKTNEVIKTPIVTINSLAATVVNTIGNTWTAKRTVSLSETEGLVTFSIPIFDLANNSITGNLTTDASRVTVDRTSPVITSVTVPAGNYGIGSTIVTTISTDANTYTGQTVTINGNPLTLVNMGDNSYKVYYTVQASDVNQSAVATLPVNIVLKDYAGNPSSAVTSAIVQSGTLTINTYPTVRITGSTTKCNYSWQKVPITFIFTGVKPYQLTYRFTSSGGTVTNFGPIPINADSYQIEGVNGGTYSLVSLTDNTTNTQTTAIANATITTNPLPSLTFNVTASPYTLGQSPDALSAYVNLTGGTFWGNGVSNGIFYPSIVGVIGEVKTSEVFYSYANAFGCRDTVSYVITVGEGVYFDGIKPNYCKNIWADKETITVQNVGTVTYENFTVTPATTGWSQVGGFSHKVEFDPRVMTPGTYTLRYDYTSGGKSDFKTQEFKVVKVTNSFDINAALKKDHYCVDTTSIQLVDNSSTPALGEGHFSGPASGFTTVVGSTSATFSPSTTVVNQDHKISYYYSKDGCNSDTVSKTIRVNTLPVIDFTVLKPNYNFNETPIVLTGSPTNIDSYFVGEVITKDGYGNTILNPSRATTIGSDITITYKYKDGVTGCSNSKPRTTRVYKADESIKVVKADLTKVDIKTTYCYADTILTISCTPIVDGLIKSGVFSSKKNAVNTLTPNTAEYSIKKADEGQDTLTFSYDIGGTSYEIKKAVYIDLVGAVSLDLYSNFCKNGEEVTIMPSHKIIPGQNIFSYDGRPAAFISYALNAKFSPQQEVEGLHQVTYTFKTDRGCSNTIKYPINVRPIPEVNFSIESDCTPGLNKDIKFVNNTSIPSGCTVANWLWDWADGTTSSAENPLPHKYLLAGSREVKLTATTDFNCVVTKKASITVGLSPIADFKWDNDCKSDNPIKFVDQSTNGTFIQWTWKLNDVVSPVDNDTINLPLPNIGKYNVELKAKTNDGCLTSVTKEIVIQPYIKFQDLSGHLYTEDFETNKYDWYPKDNSNSSWTYGNPSGEIINKAASGLKSWYTNINLTNQQLENSNIVSPCFDFTGLQKPMIKMSIWSAPDPGGDGAVLQYLLDGKGTWKNLGESNKGVNWYAPGNIQGQPGGQSYGWSSDPIMTNWNTARYNLDTLVGQKNVRFRIAYATKGTSHKQYNGFAFDDIWIGERQQNVLAEYFTSSTSTANNGYVKKFERKKKEDIVPIHYHNNDLLFNDYTAGPSSRKFYYGISVIPSVLSNGTILSTLSNDKVEFETKTDAVSLMDPKVAFDALFANNGDVVLRLKALQDLSGQSLVLYCALVKDSIQVGGTYYYNVLRKFIPSPGGIMLSAGTWIKDQVVSQTIPMNIDNPAEFINAKLVAFIQNSTTNEVYQVASYKTSALTGDHPLDISNLVDIYPNPARDYLIIECESNIEKLMVFDLAGRVIGSYIPAQARFSLPVQDMENGLYIIKGNTKKGEFIRKFIKQ